MELILFPIVAIALYPLTDWVVQRLEVAAGRRFEHRTLLFFALLLGLALLVFGLIDRFSSG